MDLGLGNLTDLKTQLLTPALQTATDFDAKLAAIGSGVVARFEKYCNRRFARVVGDQVEFSADRSYYILPRYPLEVVTLCERRDSIQEGWITYPDLIQNQSEARGLLEFIAIQGIYIQRIRITYTGGYWYDITENYSGTQPVGSALLPADLKRAWFAQVEHIWRHSDKLGLAIGDKPESAPGLEQVQLTPEVENILRNYIRWQLT